MQESNLASNISHSPQTVAARAILETLAQRGVTAAFGIPGGLISVLFNALADVPEIEYVATRHEASAGFAAMGHAISNGKPALLLTTGGPGLTNTITAVASAFVEEVPIIVIAGDVPGAATSRAALHDSTPGGLDGLALMRTVTRYAARIDSPENAHAVVEHAWRIATGPRPGPVFLSLPLDVAGASTSASRIVPSAPPEVPLPDERACAEIALALRNARRPLLVVGNGARAASAEVLLLAERLACPVVTTPHGKGVFPDAHPLHLGGIGFGGHASATDYVTSRPDVVLIVGSRLSDISTNGWRLPLTGTSATIQIDREAWLMGRNYPLTMGLVSDARAALREIVSALPLDVARPVREMAKRYAYEERVASDRLPLAPGRVVRALDAAFPAAYWAVDIGEHAAYAVHYLTIDRPERFRTLMGLASMGSGFGMAIGLKHARPRDTVIAMVGDGCFSMYAGELMTLVEARIGLIVAVMNDGRWNMVDRGLEATFGRRPRRMPARVTEIAAMAHDVGAVGMRVERAADLEPSRLRASANLGRPVVLDVRFDASQVFSTSSRAATITEHAKGVVR